MYVCVCECVCVYVLFFLFPSPCWCHWNNGQFTRRTSSFLSAYSSSPIHHIPFSIVWRASRLALYAWINCGKGARGWPGRPALRQPAIWDIVPLFIFSFFSLCCTSIFLFSIIHFCLSFSSSTSFFFCAFFLLLFCRVLSCPFLFCLFFFTFLHIPRENVQSNGFVSSFLFEKKNTLTNKTKKNESKKKKKKKNEEFVPNIFCTLGCSRTDTNGMDPQLFLAQSPSERLPLVKSKDFQLLRGMREEWCENCFQWRLDFALNPSLWSGIRNGDLMDGAALLIDWISTTICSAALSSVLNSFIRRLSRTSSLNIDAQHQKKRPQNKENGWRKMRGEDTVKKNNRPISSSRLVC